MFVISCESQVIFILVYFVVPIIFVLITKNKGVSYSQIRFFNTLFYFYNPRLKCLVFVVTDVFFTFVLRNLNSRVFFN